MLNIFSVHFEYPLAFILPVIITALYFLKRKVAAAVPYPELTLLANLPVSWRKRLRKPVLGFFSALTLIFLTLAAARPQRLTLLEQGDEARNLILALDLSRSMSARDFESDSGLVSRLSGVKNVVAKFIKERQDDRIGVVIFGSTAFLLSPLTSDHNLVSQLVEGLDFGIAEDGTAIGDGLGLSLKRLQDLPSSSKAIVLMTDGVNNSGQVEPLKAAQVAKDLGIKVHTIGIGSDDPVTIRSPDMIFGSSPRRVEFDEETLRQIAKSTGGIYFNAASSKGLSEIYEQIDALQKSSLDSPKLKQVEELFSRFCAYAILSYIIYLFLARAIFLKVP